MTTARRSPPRHRHDGTSPLPLGMDASPAPLRWTGASTVWPHDPRSGWSYCVLIPSWLILPEARTADGAAINPTVYYKVQVGIQSPQGVSSLHGSLRRFSDFLKLYAALKSVFPKKRIPAAPPKNSLLRINSSHSLLQERRRALAEWMDRLLADIDISRSATIASFLELEAAARKAAVNAINEGHEANTPAPSEVGDDDAISLSASTTRSPGAWAPGAPSEPFSAGDNCSDGTGNTSGAATPTKVQRSGSEIEMEAIVNSEALEAIKQAADTDQRPERDVLDILSTDDFEEIPDRSWSAGQVSSSSVDALKANRQNNLGSYHQRVASHGSIVSELSSARESEPTAVPSEYGGTGLDTKSDRVGGPGFPDLEVLKAVSIVLPKDQRGKVNRVFIALLQRVAIAKADMEELVTRLHQETAVKEFLTTKVRDLEGELDNTRRKSREVFRQAVSSERERITSLQWELEDTRAALLNAQEAVEREESARKAAEEQWQGASLALKSAEKDILRMQEKCKALEEQFNVHEAKAKSDKKVMAKEIKTLRKNKDDVQQATRGKLEAEAKLQELKQKQYKERSLESEFLREIGVLRQRLHECSADVLAREEGDEDESGSTAVTTVTDAIDLLSTSDHRVGFLIAEAQLLAQEDSRTGNGASFDATLHGSRRNGDHDSGGDAEILSTGVELTVRKVLTDIFIENAKLRKTLNALTRNALQKHMKDGREESGTRNSVLSKFLQT